MRPESSAFVDWLLKEAAAEVDTTALPAPVLRRRQRRPSSNA
jgi:hypothetical protein